MSNDDELDELDELDGPKLVERPVGLAGDADQSLVAELSAMHNPWPTRVGVLLISLLLLALFLWIIPGRQLEKAEFRVEGCVVQDRVDDVNPMSCRLGKLRFARLSPYTREAIEHQLARADYEYTRHSLYRALDGDSDAAWRDTLATDLLPAAAQVRATRPDDRVDWYFQPQAVLESTGALTSLATYVRAQLEDEAEIDWSLHGALLGTGDFELVAALATSQDRRWARPARAAWLCLLDHTEQGATLLEGASNGQANEAALLAAACKDEDPNTDREWSLRSDYARWRLARSLALHPERAVLDELDARELGLASFAQVVVHAKPDAQQLLRWLVRYHSLPEWTYASKRVQLAVDGVVLPELEHAPLYDPARVLGAAKHIAAEVEAAREALADLPDHMPDEAFRARYEYDAFTTTLDLAHIAGLLALEAGLEQIRRHEFEAAREAIELAMRTLPRGEQWMGAYPLLTTGDRAGTLAWVEERREQLGAKQGLVHDERVEWLHLGTVLLELHARAGAFVRASVILDELEAYRHQNIGLVTLEGAAPSSWWQKQFESESNIESLAEQPIFRYERGRLPKLEGNRNATPELIELLMNIDLRAHLEVYRQRALWARADMARRWNLPEEEARWLELLAKLRGLADSEADWLLLFETGVF